jgi:hypothetical protein
LNIIYVGCSLTQAPVEFRDAVERLKVELKKEFEVLDFLGLVAGEAVDVYRYDIGHCVGTCELFVAICDYPSIGLGYEMATAIEKHGKRVLAVAHRDAKISRLVLGIDKPKYLFRQYDNLLDVVSFAREQMAELAVA